MCRCGPSRPSFRLILGRQVSLVDSEAPTAQKCLTEPWEEFRHAHHQQRARSRIPQAIREQAGLHPSWGCRFRLVGRSGGAREGEDEGPQRAQEADGGFLCACWM